MGNKSSLMLQDDEIKQISEETGFLPSQIEKLHSRFAHLDRGNCGSLNKNDLMSIPELAINPLCDRLIQMFFSDCDQEDERINFKQFMRVLATFNSTNNTINIKNRNSNRQNHPRNSTKNILPSIGENLTKQQSEENDRTNNSNLDGLNDSLRNKLLFVFRIYDADNDGRISFNDLRCILKMMVGNYIGDVQLDKITTRAFAEVDKDSDGFIEFTEFRKVFSGKDLDDKLQVKFFN